MSASRTNRQLVNQLREGLDVEAIQVALDNGTITPRKAKNTIQFVLTVKDIRENPVYTIVDQTGRYIGEVSTKDAGASWIGCRHGQLRPLPAAEFSNIEDAKLFVASDQPGDPKTMLEYNSRVIFC